jgi:hypothetical protein
VVAVRARARLRAIRLEFCKSIILADKPKFGHVLSQENKEETCTNRMLNSRFSLSPQNQQSQQNRKRQHQIHHRPKSLIRKLEKNKKLLEEAPMEENQPETDPELLELDELEPEELDSEDDEEISSKKDNVDDEMEAEEYDPANDGDDSILAEAAREELNPNG